ncbi:MAG TPA: hypothetical protein VNO52_19245, partial [Methylomirabilota bacterium]|nr:hypothetical protein [Methylomirabilota bacterium]
YTFTATGKYFIRLRSYIDYVDDNNLFFRDQMLNGVAAGLAYELNVSLQRHTTNSDAIALNGKTVTIVEGTGRGQSATILAYDPETRDYLLDRTWAVQPDSTSRFEITFDLRTETGLAGEYSPVTDSYTVVLTGQPTAEVIVNVLPRPTRTYNSDDAFNPDTNFGENNEVQVRVATNRALVKLSGQATPGDTWSLTLADTGLAALPALEYEVRPGDGLDAVAQQLVNAVNALGSVYTATLDPNDNTAFLITATASFFADLTISPETRGAVEITGTPGASGWSRAQVELAGFVTEGETWSLTLDGTTFEYEVRFRDDLAAVARGLRAAIVANTAADLTYDVSLRGRVLTIVRRDATVFALSFSITPNSLGSATVTPQLLFTPTNWNVPQTVTVAAVDDDFIDGSDALVFAAPEERINGIRGPLITEGGIRVSEEQFLNDPFRLAGETNYPLPDGFIAGLALVNGKPTITDPRAIHTGPLFGMRPGFDPRINDFLYALTILNGLAHGVEVDIESVSRNILTLSRATGFTVDFFGVGSTSDSRVTFRGIPDEASLASIRWQEVMVGINGFVAVNQTWSVTLDGNTYSVLTDATDSLLTVVDDLKAQIELATPDTFDVRLETSVLGSRLLFVKKDGSPFTFNFAVPQNVTRTIRGLPVQADVTAPGVLWTEASFFFNGAPVAGEQWNLRVDGTHYSYTVGVGETDWAAVTEGLAEEITSLTGSEFLPGVSGDTITLAGPWPVDPMSGQPLEPGLGDEYFYAPVNLNVRVVEEDQVDTLNVFNGHSPSNDTGTLTEDRLTGFGMGGDAVIGGQLIGGGITYYNMEALRLELGTGDDWLIIESTHGGSTVVTTGAGADRVNVKTIGGHTSVSTDTGNDTITVGSDDLLMDQITGLLTLDGGADEDTVTVDDSGDGNDNTGTLDSTTLVGLDMPTVPEVQRWFVRAASGTYRLRTAGFGTDAGFASSAHVFRLADSAEVTLDYSLTADEVAARLRILYGSADIVVTENRTATNVTYTVAFVRTLAGQDFAQLEWGDTRTTTLLVPNEEASVDVQTSTLRDGTVMPYRNTLQTVTVSASSGSFRLGFRLDETDPLAVTWTAPIAFDASAQDLLAALSAILNPNNTNPALPFTDNVAVSKHGNAYHITFQGEHRSRSINPAD